MFRKMVLLSAALMLCSSAAAIAQTQTPTSPFTQPNGISNMSGTNGIFNPPPPPPDVSSTVMSHALNATPGYTSWPPSYPATSGSSYQSAQPSYLSPPNVTTPQFQSTTSTSSGGTATMPGSTASPIGTAGTSPANCVPGQTLPGC